MKRANKILGILAILIGLYLSATLPCNVSAATVSNSESDDTFATANQMNLGDTVSGGITETDDLDYYRFQLDDAGCVTLDMTSYMECYCIKIFDSDGKEIWYTDNNEWNSNVGYRRDSYDLYLEKGVYYMQINGYKYRNETYYKSTGIYECRTSFVSSGVNNVESDNDFFAANPVVLGNAIIGQISENDDYDTFQFALSKVGCVKLDMTSYMRYYCIKIFNSDGEEIWYTGGNEWTETVGYRRDAYDLYLEKGVYYMQINGYQYRNETWSKSTGRYECRTSFVSSATSFDGDDNSFSTAKSVSWKTSYTGQISIDDDFDNYKFTVPTDRNIVLNMTSYMQYYCIRILDLNGKEIWYTDVNERNSDAGYRKDVYNVVLSAGTYYMQVNGYRLGTYDKATGKYVFSIEPLTQSNCEHEYTSKTIAPSYFAKGYELHKCKKCGKSYKDHYTAQRKLGRGSISVSSKSGKGKLYLQWYTVSDASGYQIRYSKGKTMTKGVKTTTVKGQKKYKSTIKKLSRKKKYYIQIRAYKKSGAKTVYGKWSANKWFKIQ